MDKNCPVRSVATCIGCGVSARACHSGPGEEIAPEFLHDALGLQGQKESPRVIDFMKWADADSVINIISHVYAYAQHIWIRERRAAKNTSDVSVNRTETEEVPRRIMKDLSLPPKAEVCKPLYWDGIRYSGLK